MIPYVEVLDWDSRFLGYRVGRLRAEQASVAAVRAAVADARRQQYRLLYWFANPADADARVAARAVGARPVGQKVRYVGDARPLATGQVPEIQPTRQLTPQLRQLALAAGHLSRFHTDPGFAPDVYARLYTQWIENSVGGQQARAVLVYRPSAAAPEAGLLTLDARAPRADIGLLAVDAQWRHRGIGRQLVQAAQALAHDWGCTALQVATQAANAAGCQLYERCGFRPELVEDVYHLWL